MDERSSVATNARRGLHREDSHVLFERSRTGEATRWDAADTHVDRLRAGACGDPLPPGITPRRGERAYGARHSLDTARSFRWDAGGSREAHLSPTRVKAPTWPGSIRTVPLRRGLDLWPSRRHRYQH